LTEAPPFFPRGGNHPMGSSFVWSFLYNLAACYGLYTLMLNVFSWWYIAEGVRGRY
jgi:hypothetical protein